MTIILRIFAWLLAAAVTFATLGPPQLRPHSNLGQDGEHAFAFVLLGLAFGLAYTQHRLRTCALAVAGIGGLEILQLWAPGRHARLEDFAVDASGSPTTTRSRTVTDGTRSSGIEVITAFGISTAAPTAAPTVPPTISPTGPATSPPVLAPFAAPVAVVD